MFYTSRLDIDNSIFNHLKYSVEYESITKGRVGTNLVKPTDNKIPIVRTTTKYNKPSQIFNQFHIDIASKIKNTFAQFNLDFNNALIEIYNNEYKTMGFHSDQSLDLADESFIAIYSCYSCGRPNNPNTKNTRTLIIKHKETNEMTSIEMKHNSVILFSTETNKKYLHKIILDNTFSEIDTERTEWLGITFRLSKTFIEFRDNFPYFENGTSLQLCNHIESKQFYKNRVFENKLTNYCYEPVFYTLSPSDLMIPV